MELYHEVTRAWKGHLLKISLMLPEIILLCLVALICSIFILPIFPGIILFLSLVLSPNRTPELKVYTVTAESPRIWINNSKNCLKKKSYIANKYAIIFKWNIFFNSWTTDIQKIYICIYMGYKPLKLSFWPMYRLLLAVKITPFISSNQWKKGFLSKSDRKSLSFESGANLS